MMKSLKCTINTFCSHSITLKCFCFFQLEDLAWLLLLLQNLKLASVSGNKVRASLSQLGSSCCGLIFNNLGVGKHGIDDRLEVPFAILLNKWCTGEMTIKDSKNKEKEQLMMVMTPLSG